MAIENLARAGDLFDQSLDCAFAPSVPHMTQMGQGLSRWAFQFPLASIEPAIIEGRWLSTGIDEPARLKRTMTEGLAIQQDSLVIEVQLVGHDFSSIFDIARFRDGRDSRAWRYVEQPVCSLLEATSYRRAIGRFTVLMAMETPLASEHSHARNEPRDQIRRELEADSELDLETKIKERPKPWRYLMRGYSHVFRHKARNFNQQRN